MPSQKDDITTILGLPDVVVEKVTLQWHKGPKKAVFVHLRRTYPYYRCSGCKIWVQYTYDSEEVLLRDLPWWGRETYLVVRKYRVDCPRCGVRVEELPFADVYSRCTHRFELFLAQACKEATIEAVAQKNGLSWHTVQRVDQKFIQKAYSKRKWSKLRVIGVDEIARRKGHDYFVVVTDLERREVIWVGEGREQQSLNPFFETFLGKKKARRIRAACIDMWPAFEKSLREHCPKALIIYDKFHILRHLNQAVDEVRKKEFWRKGGRKRELVRGKRWLLLKRFSHLKRKEKSDLRQLLELNRKLAKAYILKENFERLWNYEREGNARRFLMGWVKSLRWSRLEPLKKFARMILDHIQGILNYCRVKVPFGVVEGLNHKIKTIKSRAWSYRNMEYYKLKIIQGCSNICTY